jgi:hypothetical protein
MSLFPFTRDGRATLVYLVFAGAGPALTSIVIYALTIIETFPGASAEERLDKYATLAILIASGMLVIVSALAVFVSIRAMKVKAGKDGFDAEISGDDEAIHDGDSITVTKE